MGRFPETYNDPKFIIQRKQLGKKYMQIDISMTVISLRKSLDLAADSFFVLVRTYQLQSKTYLILENFPHTNYCGTFTEFLLIRNL